MPDQDHQHERTQRRRRCRAARAERNRGSGHMVADHHDGSEHAIGLPTAHAVVRGFRRCSRAAASTGIRPRSRCARARRRGRPARGASASTAAVRQVVPVPLGGGHRVGPQLGVDAEVAPGAVDPVHREVHAEVLDADRHRRPWRAAEPQQCSSGCPVSAPRWRCRTGSPHEVVERRRGRVGHAHAQAVGATSGQAVEVHLPQRRVVGLSGCRWRSAPRGRRVAAEIRRCR